MKTTTWKQLKEEIYTPEQIQRLDRRVDAELAKMALQDIRESLGLTEKQLSEAIEASQADLACLDRGKNPLLATVRHYVEALGGELEVTVVFQDKRVKIEGM